MKIAYVTHTRFPTEKAHGHQVAKVCEALSALGHDVTLIAPSVGQAPSLDPMEYYNLQSGVSFEWLSQFDALNNPFVLGALAFMVSMHSYKKKLREYFSSHQFDLVYLRSPVLLSTVYQTGMPTILELHSIPRRGRSKFIADCNRISRVVALTSPMSRELVSMGVRSEQIIVEGDAVDLDAFSNPPDQNEARKEFDLPSDVPVIGYVGSLTTRDTLSKGVDVLVRAVGDLVSSGTDCFLSIVGGPERDIAPLKKIAYEAQIIDRISFAGHIDHARVPTAIAACDVCVYPAPGSSHPYFVRDTSPLKLFEYAAAGKPIVCADIPPVRDVFSEDHVTFFTPGDSASLCKALDALLSYPEESKKRATKCRALVEEHSWKKRMGRILAVRQGSP